MNVFSALRTDYQMLRVYQQSALRHSKGNTVFSMSREILAEFIEIYENEHCLWKINSKYYHDRNKRDAGYIKLLNKLKEVNSKATKDDVIKKINNMRSAIRKENSKIKKSKISGGPVYKPKLWYFSKFSFLSDQENPCTSRSKVDSDENEEITTDTDENVEKIEDIIEKNESTQKCFENLNKVATTSSSPPPNKSEKIVYAEEMVKEVQVNDYLKKLRTEEDRFDVIGKGFAIKLRGLPKQQMLLAEKLMNDILFQAEMGSLTMSHRVVGDLHSNRLANFPPVYQSFPVGSHSSISCPSPVGSHNSLS